jgi:hypothetical protein
MDWRELGEVAPIRFPHRPEGAQPDAAHRALIIASQIARQLDGALEDLAVLADPVVDEALAIDLVRTGRFE